MRRGLIVRVIPIGFLCAGVLMTVAAVREHSPTWGGFAATDFGFAALYFGLSRHLSNGAR
ncbi:MAG TPA: hypothetical protein VMD91_02900 [Candidatus Sulfotelmatobacter sp.]|nr:hypothetical protein [Candidatus Sulfotelmatobacter sp.]